MNSPSSTASTFANPSSADFAAEYTPKNGRIRHADIVLMNTIEPPPAALSGGMAAFVSCTWPKKLTSKY